MKRIEKQRLEMVKEAKAHALTRTPKEEVEWALKAGKKRIEDNATRSSSSSGVSKGDGMSGGGVVNSAYIRKATVANTQESRKPRVGLSSPVSVDDFVPVREHRARSRRHVASPHHWRGEP